MINKLIHDYEVKHWVPKVHKQLDPVMYDVFKQNGQGFYYVTFKNTDPNCVAQAISFFTGGKHISHCCVLFYSENLKSEFTFKQWQVLREKWTTYYGPLSVIDGSDVKVLVCASADENGMNFFDYSHYQYRTQTIRKVNLEVIQQLILRNYLLSNEVIDAYYDYVGLFFWWLCRRIEDKKALYCSEQVYNAFKKVNVLVAPKEFPSPQEIEDYNQNLIVYKNY